MLSAESRDKISRAKMGHFVSAETREAVAQAHRGVPVSAETRAKISAKSKGRQPALGMRHSATTRAKYSHDRMGHEVSPETRLKMRESLHRHYGTQHDPNKPTRLELGVWAYEVLRRDNATCQVCGFKKDKPKSVHAHHILSKAKWPDLALVVSNGITLCTLCHEEHHLLNGIH